MPAAPTRRSRPEAVTWALAALLVVVVGPLVQIGTAQPLVRVAQTAALVEHRSLRLDAYEPTLVVDRVDHEGHVYSDKAPLLAFATAPAYALGRLAGLESAAVDRPEGNLGIWWTTLWAATLPAAALLVLMAGAARRVAPSGAALAAGGLAFGSLLLPFAGELYGHVACAALAFGAWCLVRERARHVGPALAGGALAGAAVATEYPMALVAVVLAVAVGVLHGWSRAAWFVAGTVPFAAFLLWYQWAAFGDPLTHPYRLKPQHEAASSAVTGLPRPGQAVEVLLGARGLILFAPVVLVGLAGLVLLARRPGPGRADAAVGLAVFGALWLLQAGWANPWGGEMPGPRYLIPALPFLAVGVAAVAERRAALVRVAVAWGVVAMAGPLLTVHLVLGDGVTGRAHLDNLTVWGAAPPVWVLALGGGGWLVYGLTVLVAVGAVVRAGRAAGPPPIESEQEFATNGPRADRLSPCPTHSSSAGPASTTSAASTSTSPATG